MTSTQNKKGIFRVAGRLGNAIFRYMAGSVFCIKNNLDFILESEFGSTERYIFYKGKDCPQHDLFFFQGSIEEMFHRADDNDQVLCFNTLGYFKNKFDPQYLVSNQYINQDNGQGLFVKNYVTLTDGNVHYYLDKDLRNINVEFKGYYQYNFITEYRNQILEYMENHKDHYVKTDRGDVYYIKDIIEEKELSESKIYDIVIHIRLGDFFGRIDFIEYEYYEKLFEKIDFNNKKVCVMVDKFLDGNDVEFLNKVINWFFLRGIHVPVEANDIFTDFNIMKQARILICSMSTLSWCAGFLSKKIECCYMPNYNFSIDRNIVSFKKPIENTIFYEVKSSELFKTKAMILTLQDFPERQERICRLTSKLEEVGLKQELFYGVNGKNIRINETNDIYLKQLVLEGETKTFLYDRRVRLNGELMRAGQFGIIWSKYNIFCKLLEDPENDNYLILEDDAELVVSVSELFLHLSNLPENYDIIHLAKSDWYPFIKTDRVNDFYYSVARNYFNRTTAYIISKRGAEKMVKHLETFMNVPLDDMICHYYLRNFDFNFYVPSNYLFHEPENTVSIIDKINHS